MKSIVSLGLASSFLGGVALALLASYPIGENSVYVCFVALFLGMVACVLGVWSMLLEATKRNRIHAERVIDLTVDRLLQQRGLELVDRD